MTATCSDIQALTVRAIEATHRMRAVYGSPRLNNKDDPLDELVFIVLSQMTTGPSYERVFEKLKSGIDGWSSLDLLPIAQIQSLILDAGLANQKAPRLAAIAKRLRADFGEVSLSPLGAMTDRAAEDYLTSLPGVGTKTAKCVLMYSLGRKVLPIDTHVARISHRLGLLGEEVSHAGRHPALEAVVVADERYDFHVNALAHGRAVCLALRPRCGRCVLNDICPSCQLSVEPHSVPSEVH